MGRKIGTDIAREGWDGEPHPVPGRNGGEPHGLIPNIHATGECVRQYGAEELA